MTGTHSREVGRLIAPGVLGFYTHIEVTEIFAMIGRAEPINVFTIAVAEDREDEPLEAEKLLNGARRIKLKSLKDWQFGIARYTCSLADLVPALERLEHDGSWDLSGEPLKTATLASVPPQFVPPDSFAPVPLNHVLKNNFWNGSHVFEWADRGKMAFAPFFEDSRRLQELSEEIQKYVPIRLAALSDRLGNLVVQLPVQLIVSSFSQRRTGEFTVALAWHPKATPRDLRASCELDFDGTLDGFASWPVGAPETDLPVNAGRGGPHHGIIWDEAHMIVLAATGPSAFIKSIALNVQALDPEPRTFSVRQNDGSMKPYRLGMSGHGIQNIVGQQNQDADGGWTQKRIFAEESKRLGAERRFVQYLPNAGQGEEEHERGLEDIRFLIRGHGKEGVWLWDPFLSAHDILETLFHCPYGGVDLRALTAGNRPPPNGAEEPRGAVDPADNGGASTTVSTGKTAEWIKEQRNTLDGTPGNLRGLRLEYRIKRGPEGWRFHDRFLIFPKGQGGAEAWSLGTSVNSLGREHHILQYVAEGQRIANAFRDLWDCLIKPEHLIWKRP